MTYRDFPGIILPIFTFGKIKYMSIFDFFKKAESTQTPAGPVTFLVVGLGNPGKEYLYTRHNTGFLALDYIAERLSVTINRAKFNALTADAVLGGNKVLLMKPQTYMNESGVAVRQAADFYKIPTDHIIVISDDISLPVGMMRVRKSGSDGGQKGLRSIISHLGSDGFPRLRIGIGEKPHPDYPLADWVLSEFTKEEQKVLTGEFDTAMSGIEKMIAGDFDTAMMICNSKKR